MKGSRLQVDLILVVGTLLSVSVSLVLLLLKIDESTSLIIGLLGAILALLIDLIARLHASEKRLASAISIAEALVADDWLRDTMGAIVNDYKGAAAHRFDVFTSRARDALQECAKAIHSLREGSMTVDINSQFTFGRAVMDETERSFQTVQFADPAFWRTGPGERYLDANRRLIQRGIPITRIWVQSLADIVTSRDLIEQQIKIGIETWVVDKDKIPRELLGEFGIVDDRIVVSLDLVQNHARSETISVDPSDVENFREIFRRLHQHARPAAKMFEEMR